MKQPVEQNINYDRVQDQILKKAQQLGQRPRILVHSCCAPCSTYVLEKLTQYADVTIFFYNPNIHPKEEYIRREFAQRAFIAAFNERTNNNVGFIAERYQQREFFEVTKGLEEEKEGTGERCSVCYELRINEVAKRAEQEGYDYFASGLTLSPKKNSKKINEIGFELEQEYNVAYLPSDFKKQNGYKRSIEMCKEYEVYRQCYCGCVFAAKQQGIDFRQIIKEAREQNAKYREMELECCENTTE